MDGKKAPTYFFLAAECSDLEILIDNFHSQITGPDKSHGTFQSKKVQFCIMLGGREPEIVATL